MLATNFLKKAKVVPCCLYFTAGNSSSPPALTASKSLLIVTAQSHGFSANQKPPQSPPSGRHRKRALKATTVPAAHFNAPSPIGTCITGSVWCLPTLGKVQLAHASLPQPSYSHGAIHIDDPSSIQPRGSVRMVSSTGRAGPWGIQVTYLENFPQESLV